MSRIGQFLGQCGFQAGNDDFQLYRQLESVLPVAVQVDTAADAGVVNFYLAAARDQI